MGAATAESIALHSHFLACSNIPASPTYLTKITCYITNTTTTFYERPSCKDKTSAENNFLERNKIPVFLKVVHSVTPPLLLNGEMNPLKLGIIGGGVEKYLKWGLNKKWGQLI